MVQQLGEIDWSTTGYLPQNEHQMVAEAFFAHPDTSIRGWETARDAQRRIVAAIDAILADDQGRGNVATVSHGAVGTLYLCYLMHVDISRDEARPGAHGATTTVSARPHGL